MIASIFAGAGLSLITNLLESVFGVVKEWQRRKLMVLEHTQTIELARMNSDIRLAEAESERETAALEMEGAAFNASYAHATAIPSGFAWVSAILSLVRPALTLGLMVIAYRLIEQTADPDLTKAAILAVLELAGTAVSWWFGDRSFKRARGQ